MHFAIQRINNGTAATAARFFLPDSDTLNLSASVLKTGVLSTAASKSTTALPDKLAAAVSSQNLPPEPNICPI